MDRVIRGARILILLVRRGAQARRLEEIEQRRPELVLHLDAEDLLELWRPLRALHLVALEVVDGRRGQGWRSRWGQGLQGRHHQDVRLRDVELDRAELVHNDLVQNLDGGPGDYMADQMLGMRGRVGHLVTLVGRGAEAVREAHGLGGLAELILHREVGDDVEGLGFDLVALEVVGDDTLRDRRRRCRAGRGGRRGGGGRRRRGRGRCGGRGRGGGGRRRGRGGRRCGGGGRGCGGGGCGGRRCGCEGGGG